MMDLTWVRLRLFDPRGNNEAPGVRLDTRGSRVRVGSPSSQGLRGLGFNDDLRSTRNHPEGSDASVSLWESQTTPFSIALFGTEPRPILVSQSFTTGIAMMRVRAELMATA